MTACWDEGSYVNYGNIEQLAKTLNYYSGSYGVPKFFSGK